MLKKPDPQKIRQQFSSEEFHMVDDMERFNHKYGFDKVHKQEMTREFLQFRMRFIIEEVQEMCKAHNENNAEEFVDSIIDMIVVGIGTLQFMGVDVRKAWNEVFMSNMTKQRDVNPKRNGSGGIDLIKPDSWVAPNHSDNVGIIPEIFEEPGSLMGVCEVGMYMANEPDVTVAEMIDYVPDRDGVTLFPKKNVLEKTLIEIRNELDGETYIDQPVMVMLEAIQLRIRKGKDYNAGGVQLSDYFIFGVDSVFNEIHKKYLRMRSVLSKLRNGQSEEFESVEDTFLDLMVYASFGVCVMRGVLPGQSGSVFGERVRSLKQ